MQYLDKAGWPVETVKGRWFRNLLRRLVHTRIIRSGTWPEGQKATPDPCVGTEQCPDKVAPDLTLLEKTIISSKSRSRVRDRSPRSREPRSRS